MSDFLALLSGLQTKDSKAFWRAIKLLNKQESSIPTLVSNGSKVEGSKEKATLLNHFFHGCFNKTLPPLVPQPSLLSPDGCPAVLLCSEEEVFDLISSLDTSKSTGPDGISARMLKSVATSITPSLTRLFNLSLSTGILPDPWKRARIVPIPKSTQNQSSPTNYRPISILPLVSKLLEKHVHKLLFCHLHENYPISSRQWGFLPGRSAQSALLSVTHNWFQQLEKGNEVCCVFFDLKKAFDSVPHSLLIQKLSEIVVDPYIIQWIHNYLTCRSQFVVVGGEQSCVLPVISGVPQGSVLGPLLFLVFINEVVDQVSLESSMSLFADDIALYRHIKSSVDYWKLQLDITALVDWISRHYLSLQPSKCCYMLITRKRTCSIPPPILYVSEIPLQLVSSVRYLGVQLNSDLSWSPHITNLCTKARQLVGLLYRRFYKHANTSTLLQLYKSFIRPHLEYCAIVWDPHLLKDVEALEKVQRFALRMCLKNWSLDHNQLYQQSNLPPLVNRRSNAKLCHLYRIVNDLCDFPDAPVQQREIVYDNRQTNHLQLSNMQARTNQFHNSYFPKTISLWNSLPFSLLSSSSLSSFKLGLKQST